jgi:hypothetical protein
MRPAARHVKMAAMPDPDFQFARIASVNGEALWQVRFAGRFLGTLAEVEGGWRATIVVAGGKARFRSFADRNAAARWLATATD